MTCSCSCHTSPYAACSVPGGCGSTGCGRTDVQPTVRTARDDSLILRIAGDVQALVEPRKHVEPYYEWVNRHRKLRAHKTEQPSLLDQLSYLADEPLAPEQAEPGRSVPKSRLPGGEDALDRLMAIEAGSAKWVSVYLRRDLRPTVEENLRLLVGASTHLRRHVDLVDLADDVHRWHGWAATLTGWQTPPWRPRVACPLCERTGSLRIHLDAKRATCLGCGEVWSDEDGTIVLLADYIRELGEAGEPDTRDALA